MKRHAPEPLDLPLKLWLARWTNGISPASVTLAYADWLSHLLSSPSHQAGMADSAMRKWLLWLQYGVQAARGECPLCTSTAPNDKRFVAPASCSAHWSWSNCGRLKLERG